MLLTVIILITILLLVSMFYLRGANVGLDNYLATIPTIIDIEGNLIPAVLEFNERCERVLDPSKTELCTPVSEPSGRTATMTVDDLINHLQKVANPAETEIRFAVYVDSGNVERDDREWKGEFTRLGQMEVGSGKVELHLFVRTGAKGEVIR